MNKTSIAMLVVGIIAGFLIGILTSPRILPLLQTTHSTTTIAPNGYYDNVTNVNITYYDMQTGKAYFGGALNGFVVRPDSPYFYNFSVVYKNLTYNETIENITILGGNFKLVGVMPVLPQNILPGTSKAFTLEIASPNTTYLGPISVAVLYKIDYRNAT